MKILIVSDTHGSNAGLEEAISENTDIDMLIHLGDVEGAEDYIRMLVACPVHVVRGNNDFFSDLPKEEEFDLMGYHVWITHGNSYGVSLDENVIREEAHARGADIVMYGHTHRPVFHKDDGVYILNPGSISYPRQKGRKRTYMIMEIDEGGGLRVTLKCL